MTNAVQNLAKIMNVSEQQAYTFARCISYQMSKNADLTIEQAVENHMAAMEQMVSYAKQDSLSPLIANEIYDELRKGR